MKTFRPKLFDTLKAYSGKQLAADVVAGIVAAIIALPFSRAFAKKKERDARSRVSLLVFRGQALRFSIVKISSSSIFLGLIL